LPEATSNNRNGFFEWFGILLDGFVDLIYPPSCALCGRVSSEEICHRCLAELLPLGDEICPKCGNPCTRGAVCLFCTAIDFKFDKAQSFYHYEEPLRDAVLDFKYHHSVRKGAALTNLFSGEFRKTQLAGREFDVVIPVPATPSKKRRRGYNQTEIMARGLSEVTGIPVAPYGLMKKRDTRSQTGLDFKGRVSNVEGSIYVPDGSIIDGKMVLLVDDIITTGATISECADVLKSNGAKEVVAVSLARGVLY
jgi:competence protein ComFC